MKGDLESVFNSIEFFLNPDVFAEEKLVDEISDQLADGHLIVIRNAFQDAFADHMFSCLDQFHEWRLYEGYQPHFHYHHHNIYDESLFPAELGHCHDIFSSEATKSFVQRLSRRDCSGDLSFSASLYLPGDYSLPHNDRIHAGPQRQVAFIWNLTKHWQADGGGEFFWCKKSKSIPPAFNTLFLFNVDYDSVHFVTLVSPHAQGKRLAISGWWTGPSQSKTDAAKHSGKAPSEMNLLEII